MEVNHELDLNVFETQLLFCGYSKKLTYWTC